MHAGPSTFDAPLASPSSLSRVRHAPWLGTAERLLGITQLGSSVLSGLMKQEPGDCARGALALHRLARSLCRAHGWQAQVHGELPAHPVVLVSNHLSYIDPLIHCSLLPCSPIAKSEVAEWPLIGKVGANLAVNFVRRGDRHSGAAGLRRALSALRAGVSVLNFPEGTTTSGRMLHFRRGVFGLARIAGVPVVPLAISFDRRELAWIDDQMLLPHYARTLRSGPCVVRVEVGPEMQPEDFASPAQMAGEARRWIHGQLQRVYPELRYDDGPRISLMAARKAGRDLTQLAL